MLFSTIQCVDIYSHGFAVWRVYLSSSLLAKHHINVFWCSEYCLGKSLYVWLCVETDLECKKPFDLYNHSHPRPLTPSRSLHSIHSHLL